MNLPTVITDLVKARNNFDSQAYTDCFTEAAVVYDEGKTHIGKTAIKNWIEKAMAIYRAVMKPTEYLEAELIRKDNFIVAILMVRNLSNYSIIFKNID